MPAGCRHAVLHEAVSLAPGQESVFSIDAAAVAFGRGAIREVGEHVRDLVPGASRPRVAVFTDRSVARLPFFAAALLALRGAGAQTEVYDAVEIEPTDRSFRDAGRFAAEGRFDAYVSVGGGSTIDTCKAAALQATFPGDLLDWVNAPLGAARPIPGPLPPHVACPTTCGTGSECTGIAVFDLLEAAAKTGIASRRLRPALALVDPDATRTLPAPVVAASGFDVVCHAIESFTARPYHARPTSAPPRSRPMSQGRNPWSDLGSLEALRLGGRALVRAVTDPTDDDARHALSWAATLAGIAFGNAGCHLPHGMSYAVSGLAMHAGAPLVPHGVSVVLNAPSVFRHTACACPERHLHAAEALGADLRDAGPDDAGEVLAAHLAALMAATGVPAGLRSVGFGEADLDALAARALLQKRLVDNAPRPVDHAAMRELFAGALG